MTDEMSPPFRVKWHHEASEATLWPIPTYKSALDCVKEIEKRGEKAKVIDDKGVVVYPNGSSVPKEYEI